MILTQLNPLRLYSDKRSRQWENTEVNKDIRIITYPIYVEGINKLMIPFIDFNIPSVPTGQTLSVSAIINNCNGIEVFSGISWSAMNKGEYTQIHLGGDIFENVIPGFYEFKITVNSEVFYSDMFQVAAELSKLLKVDIDSSSIRLGNVYITEMLYSHHVFYLPLKQVPSNGYIKEDAIEKYAITSTTFASRSLIHGFLVIGSEPIYMFLSALRIFGSNGIVLLTNNYVEYNCVDITVEIETDHSPTQKDIKVEFKVLNESVSTVN